MLISSRNEKYQSIQKKKKKKKEKKHTLNHQKTDQLKKFSIKFTHQASKSLTRSRLSSPSLSHQTATIFLNREPDQSFIQGNEEG